MTQSAIHTENPRASWLAFLASPAAPKRPMSVLELDGYLTGVIVAPTVIPPSLWMASLWVDEEPVFDNDAQIQSVLGGIGAFSFKIWRHSQMPAPPHEQLIEDLDDND